MTMILLVCGLSWSFIAAIAFKADMNYMEEHRDAWIKYFEKRTADDKPLVSMFAENGNYRLGKISVVGKNNIDKLFSETGWLGALDIYDHTIFDVTSNEGIAHFRYDAFAQNYHCKGYWSGHVIMYFDDNGKIIQCHDILDNKESFEKTIMNLLECKFKPTPEWIEAHRLAWIKLFEKSSNDDTDFLAQLSDNVIMKWGANDVTNGKEKVKEILSQLKGKVDIFGLTFNECSCDDGMTACKWIEFLENQGCKTLSSGRFIYYFDDSGLVKEIYDIPDDMIQAEKEVERVFMCNKKEL